MESYLIPLDNLIELWHSSDTAAPIHEFLGLTLSEYAELVTTHRDYEVKYTAAHFEEVWVYGPNCHYKRQEFVPADLKVSYKGKAVELSKEQREEILKKYDSI